MRVLGTFVLRPCMKVLVVPACAPLPAHPVVQAPLCHFCPAVAWPQLVPSLLAACGALCSMEVLPVAPPPPPKKPSPEVVAAQKRADEVRR
jgi:hypothetical protein